MDLSQYMALVGWYFINVRYFIKKNILTVGIRLKRQYVFTVLPWSIV